MIKNQSAIDIINNDQQHFKRVTYNDGEMSACIDIGKLRKTQEDSVLIMNHPLNPEYKLLAVADGMGGLEKGNLASNITLYEILKWFEHLPIKYLNNDTNLLPILKERIIIIDEVVRRCCGTGGTTLSVAIISKENTFAVNLGDSRIYVYYKNKLIQISEEHSLTWELLQKGQIKQKDDMRFHKENNLITSRIGCARPKLIIGESVIDNHSFEKLMLFTDGVTDCLSESDIIHTIKNSSDHNLCTRIINKALTNNSINYILNADLYYQEILGGKDNATAAIYIKKQL